MEGESRSLWKWIRTTLWGRVCVVVGGVATVVTIIGFATGKALPDFFVGPPRESAVVPSAGPEEALVDDTSVTMSPAPQPMTVQLGDETRAVTAYEVASSGCVGDIARIVVGAAGRSEVELHLALDALTPRGRAIVARDDSGQAEVAVPAVGATSLRVKLHGGKGAFSLVSTPAKGADCGSPPVLVIVN